MRIWNLSDVGELNQVVVDEFSKKPQNRLHVVRRQISRRECFKLVAGVATVAISLSVGIAQVNQSTVQLPNWTAALVRTAPDFRPPLEKFFLSRFDSAWTETEEKSLANQIVNNLLTNRAADSAVDVASFIYSNQQESIALESPRLNLAVIERIVRKRKIS